MLADRLPKVWLWLGVAVLGAGGGWTVNGWRGAAQLEAVKRSHLETLNGIHAQTIRVQGAIRAVEQEIQTSVAAADKKHYEELQNEKAQTQRLRDCIGAGTCGVRLITKYVYQPSSDGGEDAATSDVGHDTLALDEGLQLRILDLRDAIAEDAEKLEYLQAYSESCQRI